MPHSCLIVARSNLVGLLHPSHLVIKASIALDSIPFNLQFQSDHSNERSSLSLQFQKLQFHVSSSNIDAGQQRFQVRAPKKKGRSASSGREHASLMFDHCSQQFGWPPPPQPPRDKGFNCIGFHPIQPSVSIRSFQ